MISKFYGKSYSLQTLRSKAFISRAGVSMLGISDAAESIGFRTRGYRLTWEQLRDEVTLPCIVHWNQRHFVVVYDIKKKQKVPVRFRGKAREEAVIHVADPASGLIKYSESEFKKCWYSTKNEGVQEGTALLLEPSPDFYRQEGDERGKLKFLYLFDYIKPYTIMHRLKIMRLIFCD